MKSNNIKYVKDYFISYCIENNASDEMIEKLLDIIYNDTISYFDNYIEFYQYFTDEF